MSTIDPTSCLQILDHYGIEPTANRIRILQTILQQPERLFLRNDILGDLRKRKVSVSDSSVTFTLKLFCIRGILITEKGGGNKKAGRPQSVFALSEAALSHK